MNDVMVFRRKWYIPVKFSFCFICYINSWVSAEVKQNLLIKQEFQLAFTCWKSTREALEKSVKYF